MKAFVFELSTAICKSMSCLFQDQGSHRGPWFLLGAVLHNYVIQTDDRCEKEENRESLNEILTLPSILVGQCLHLPK